MKSEYIILNLLVSSGICLVMYLVTAILFSYDGLYLHHEPVGILALLAYFLVPFISIQALDFKGN